MKLAVIGAGAWGTALAVTLSANYSVYLWSRRASHAADLRRDDENKQYLPGVGLGRAVQVLDEIEPALESAGLVLFAVPTAGLRDTLRSARDYMGDAGGIWVCKGFEPGTGKLPHEVAAEELLPATRLGADVLLNRQRDFANRLDLAQHVFGEAAAKSLLQRVRDLQPLERVHSHLDDVRVQRQRFRAFSRD